MKWEGIMWEEEEKKDGIRHKARSEEREDEVNASRKEFSEEKKKEEGNEGREAGKETL